MPGRIAWHLWRAVTTSRHYFLLLPAPALSLSKIGCHDDTRLILSRAEVTACHAVAHHRHHPAHQFKLRAPGHTVFSFNKIAIENTHYIIPSRKAPFAASRIWHYLYSLLANTFCLFSLIATLVRQSFWCLVFTTILRGFMATELVDSSGSRYWKNASCGCRTRRRLSAQFDVDDECRWYLKIYRYTFLFASRESTTPVC